MLWAGGLADRFRARAVAAATLCLLALACLGMAATQGWWTLALAVFGLRLCGQGMMFHTAIVCMGRWFQAARGRAVALASLGIATGEALLPVAFAALIGAVGWRWSWVVAAACALALAPLALALLRRERSPRGDLSADSAPGMEGRHWSRADALRHWLFWAAMPAVLTPPIFGTAFFFQQVRLTEEKGWELVAFAAFYPLFVVMAVPMSFLGGWIADRFGSARLAPLYMLPMAAGFLIASLFDGLWAGGAALALLGGTTGFGVAMSGAFWPEHYGTRHLGAIRATASSAMVFGTALGPALTGALIDVGVDFSVQLAWIAAYAAAMSAALGIATARVRRTLPGR
jgi:MFS family permease